MRIVMMGTGTFAEPTFEALLAAFPGEVVGLVTQPERDIGRRSGSSRQVGQGMASIAAAAGVPVIQPASINTPEGLTLLAAMQPELLVVAAYGQILKPEVIALPRLGAINVHASLLPKYRGAAPVAYAIWKGETQTGVTIIRISPGLDSGEMLARESVAIAEQETAGELEFRLGPIGAGLAVHVVTRLKLGTVDGVKQDPALVTKAPKLTKENGLIDWTRPAAEVACQVRAMQPWPTAYTFFHRTHLQPMRILVLETMELGLSPNLLKGAEPGTPCTLDGKASDTVYVKTGYSDTLGIQRLQPAGKKPMSASEFLRGYPLCVGDRFGPAELS